jgi:ABC-2 type transport system permease protein
MTSVLRLMGAFVLRDFRVATSYKFNFLFQLTYGFFIVSAFYFIAKMADNDTSRQILARYNASYFSYILVGIASAGLMATSLNGFAEQMRNGMTEGSLEMTFACPVRPSWIVVLPCLWSYVFESLKAGLVLVVGATIFGADLHRANLLSGVAMLLLSVTSYAVFGVLGAALTLVLKRADIVYTVFSAATALLGGAFFPIDLFPGWLRAISGILPMTYAYEGLRLSLLGGAGPYEIRSQLAILAVFSVICLPLAFLVASAAIAKAKRDGSLGVF